MQTLESNSLVASDPRSSAAQLNSHRSGIIAGVVCGGLAGLCVICTALCVWLKRRRKARKLTFMEPSLRAATVAPDIRTTQVSMGLWQIPAGARLYVRVSVIEVSRHAEDGAKDVGRARMTLRLFRAQ
jgi:hypothetical protein